MAAVAAVAAVAALAAAAAVASVAVVVAAVLVDKMPGRNEDFVKSLLLDPMTKMKMMMMMKMMITTMTNPAVAPWRP